MQEKKGGNVKKIEKSEDERKQKKWEFVKSIEKVAMCRKGGKGIKLEKTRESREIKKGKP